MAISAREKNLVGISAGVRKERGDPSSGVAGAGGVTGKRASTVGRVGVAAAVCSERLIPGGRIAVGRVMGERLNTDGCAGTATVTFQGTITDGGVETAAIS